MWHLITTQKDNISAFADLILKQFSKQIKKYPQKSLQRHYQELSFHMLAKASHDVAVNKEMWSKWIVDNGRNDFTLTFFFILFFIEDQVRQTVAAGFNHIQLYLDLLYSKAIFYETIPYHYITQEERYVIAWESIRKEVNEYEEMKLKLLEELRELVLGIYRERLNHYKPDVEFPSSEITDSYLEMYKSGYPNARRFAKEVIKNHLLIYSDQEVLTEAEVDNVISEAERAYRVERKNKDV